MAVQIEKPRRPINVVLRSFARQSVQAMEQGFRTQHVWPYEIYPGFAKINAIRKARAMRGGKDWFATGEGLKSFQYEVMSAAQGNETIRMGGKDVNVRAYLSRFNFSGADQEKKCGVLSGGERNRLHLAIALKQEGNVLLLDEPTNDIDVNTLRALEEGLEAFAGCAVIISHDRWFLDRICTHILAFEGEGNVFYFEGNYSEYESNKAQRLGLEEPKRARYRKLMDE